MELLMQQSQALMQQNHAWSRGAARKLIAHLQAEDMFGLEAPRAAQGWTKAQIEAFFESDGEEVPK